MEKLSEILKDVKTLGIAGHVRPDGDCVGSCMGLYLYLKKNYPQIRTDLYLEEIRPEFSYIKYLDEIKHEPGPEKIYDLFITCDASSLDRIGVALSHFNSAKKTVCIDHHISNPGFAQINHIEGHTGSASEILYTLMDPEKIDLDIAVAIYTGMIHDTGVFQYTCTSPRTLRIAADLISLGIPFSQIIDSSFYEKTYLQNKAMGHVLAESFLILNGKCLVGYLTKKDMEAYGVVPMDLEGIVSQLRLTTGIEVAVFLYENQSMSYKVSLRSKNSLDVSRIARYFGGGGHAKAAGCTIPGTMHDVVNALTRVLEPALKEKMS